MSEQPDPAPGVLLIAAPTLEDSNFRRRVVLLCDHNESGSVGLVLNHQTEISLARLVDELPDYDQGVFVGGPVQQNVLHVLHRHGNLIEGSLKVIEGLSWGGQVENIRQLLDLGYADPADIRFFLGYAGWGPDQLNSEIANGGWILSQAPTNLLFSISPDRLWRELLRKMGGEYALLSNFPDDPKMN